MLIIDLLTVSDAMLTSANIAEPDTGLGETAWSSSEIVVAGAERILGSPTSTVTMTVASPCVVTWASNGLAVDTPIVFTNSGGALPTGITSGETYYVAARPTSGTLTIKDADGRTVNTSGSQSGTHTATAKVHKVYVAAVGYSATIASIDTAANTLSLAAHGFVEDQPLVFTTTGAMPNPLVSGTLYYVEVVSAGTFEVKTNAGDPAGINITTAGSGTLTVHYGTASGGPNLNKPPAINADFWTLVGSTNKWAMHDTASSTSTEGTSQLHRSIVPSAEWDAVAFQKLVGASGITLHFEINRATVTATAATDKINWTGHGLAANSKVLFTTTTTLPAPLAVDTIYYVRNPGANDFEVSLTSGGASINITDTGTGTHTGGYAVIDQTVDHTLRMPIATGLVSAANRALSAYKNGTLTVIITGSGAITCAEMFIGVGTEIGTTVDEIANRIRNFSRYTEDEFGNVTKTIRGYKKELRGSATVENSADFGIDDATDYLEDHKDDDLLIVLTDELATHVIYGSIVDWEMTGSDKHLKVLKFKVDGRVIA